MLITAVTEGYFFLSFSVTVGPSAASPPYFVPAGIDLSGSTAAQRARCSPAVMGGSEWGTDAEGSPAWCGASDTGSLQAVVHVGQSEDPHGQDCKEEEDKPPAREEAIPLLNVCP